MKFEVGDRVFRPEDVLSPEEHGEVIGAYSKTRHFSLACGEWIPEYPELYRVRWDNGVVGNGYLPHGLMKEEEDEG